MSNDKYKPGDTVLILKAGDYPHLVGTRAHVVAARAWRLYGSRRTGERFQLFTYKILAFDGRTYASEEYALAPGLPDAQSKAAWVELNRDEKISLGELTRSIGWQPKKVASTYAANGLRLNGAKANRRK